MTRQPTRPGRSRSIAALGWLLLLAGCASYTPSAAPAVQPETLTSIESGGTAVAAQPFVDKQQQKAVFDADFDKADVLAIRVSVRNTTGRKLLVRRSDMTLTLPDGGIVAATTAESVAAKVGEGRAVLAVGAAFGLIGALAATSARDQARKARTADYSAKAFRDTDLEQDTTVEGFVFFLPPNGTPAFDQSMLGVSFVDVELAKRSTIEVPLAGLSFEPSGDDN